MNIDETIAAIGRLRTDAEKLPAGLLKHERVLAAGRLDEGHKELHSFVHRMTRLVDDMRRILAEPAPSAAR